MKVKIRISPKGEVHIEGHEHSGPECADIADKLAGAVGDKSEQKLKQEYYEVPEIDYNLLGEG